MFHTNYSTDGERFQNYYKDVSLRMKNKELDLLIVVNMFLTGFDATTLNLSLIHISGSGEVQRNPVRRRKPPAGRKGIF